MDPQDQSGTPSPTHYYPNERVNMKVKTVAMDAEAKNPVMILCDTKEYMYLPIWIGPFEAKGIMDALEGAIHPRPMTYDLFLTVMNTMGRTVSNVEIYDLQEQTYLARLTLSDPGGVSACLEARPSDAVALALRSGAAIFVSKAVAERACILDKSKIHDESTRLGGPVPIE